MLSTLESQNHLAENVQAADEKQVVVAEHDDETLPLFQVPPLRMTAADNSRLALQVTTDISVGGASAIGAQPIDLALLDRIVDDVAENA